MAVQSHNSSTMQYGERTAVGTLMLLFFSGAISTIAFDIWGQVISPGPLNWANLAPVPLATQTINVLTGIQSREAGHFLHLFLVGLVAYPFGYLFIARPILSKLNMNWFVAGTLYGIGLFVVAIGIIAGPLIAGNPWFLNWGGITYVALIGHTLYGIVCAAAVQYLEAHGIR